MKRLSILAIAAALTGFSVPDGQLHRVRAQEQTGSRVEILATSGKPALVANGKIFTIRGAGGDGSRKLLAQCCGGNSIRTWGDRAGGYNLSGAKKLSFWARGERGGEKVKFGVGLIGDDKPYRDSTKTEAEIALTQDWRQHEFKLAGRDLSRIKSGFFWTLAAQGENVAFYLDDIQFE